MKDVSKWLPGLPTRAGRELLIEVPVVLALALILGFLELRRVRVQDPARVDRDHPFPVRVRKVGLAVGPHAIGVLERVRRHLGGRRVREAGRYVLLTVLLGFLELWRRRPRVETWRDSKGEA